MEKVILLVEKLKKTKVKEKINNRMREFEEIGKKSSNEIFKELCFCIMTANFSAERAIKIQKEIGDGFLNLPKIKIKKKLSQLGHRFPNMRGEFIAEARKYKNNLKEILNSFENEKEARDWIVNNIKGIGMKESSHFLRNIGYKNLAIIDFHIIDFLKKNNLIKKSKVANKKDYECIENILEKIAKKTNTSIGELDLYLWYNETGKILK